MSYFAPDPLKIENPEFKCTAPNEYALEADVAISEYGSGSKFTRYSTLSFCTDNMGGYPFDIAVRLGSSDPKEWITQDDVTAITIRFRGDYEADILRTFLQHAGSMATVVYGQYINRDEEET